MAMVAVSDIASPMAASKAACLTTAGEATAHRGAHGFNATHAASRWFNMGKSSLKSSTREYLFERLHDEVVDGQHRPYAAGLNWNHR